MLCWAAVVASERVSIEANEWFSDSHRFSDDIKRMFIAGRATVGFGVGAGNLPRRSVTMTRQRI